MKTIKMEDEISTDEQEHLILSQLDHDNIVKYYQHFEEDRSGFKYFYIVTVKNFLF